MPFAIGDIEPGADFVHVFDEVALDIVLRELDTITDFTDYLDKRAAFLRSGHLIAAHGGEDLLAYYAIRTNDAGEHDFTAPQGRTWDEVGGLTLGEGHYAHFISDPQYIAKKRADKISYLWDGLIQTFTKHMMGGTSIVLPGYEYSLSGSELAVRHMALVNRFVRRNHGQAILGALEMGKKGDSFFRAMLPGPTDAQPHTGFFFLTYKYLDWMEEQGGYEQYRLARTLLIQTYAQALLMQHAHLQQVVGIATEPPDQGRGSSEDNVLALQQEWTDEQRRQINEDCANLGIMKRLKQTRYSGEEYPEVRIAERQAKPANFGNRAERRAREAKLRRSKPKGVG